MYIYIYIFKKIHILTCADAHQIVGGLGGCPNRGGSGGCPNRGGTGGRQPPGSRGSAGRQPPSAIHVVASFHAAHHYMSMHVAYIYTYIYIHIYIYIYISRHAFHIVFCGSERTSLYIYIYLYKDGRYFRRHRYP